jgi:hypothetical protein
VKEVKGIDEVEELKEGPSVTGGWRPVTCDRRASRVLELLAEEILPLPPVFCKC